MLEKIERKNEYFLYTFISIKMPKKFVFPTLHPLEKRQEESARICKKYPDRIPLIIEPADNAPAIDKNKYLVPKELTFGQLKFVVRKRTKLVPEQALFFFIDGSIIPADSSLIGHLFDKNKNVDGFLYIQYTLENTFGG
jgi:GABA(A) receptor-associated protein